MLNAMIFAAGLGTRLMPLTQNTPKAMVQVNGQPLLWYAIHNVIQAGATRIVVNVHHFAPQIIAYLNELSFPGVEIMVSDERDQLLETGGGLLKAKNLFVKDAPILIHNADVLTNSNLTTLVNQHRTNGALATLMVQQRPTQRYLLFDCNDELCGWENLKTGERIITRDKDHLQQMAFNGIQMVDYRILEMLGGVRKFSITRGYLDLSPDYAIRAWKDWQGQWFDIGTIEKLHEAIHEFKHNTQ
ncbi:nucleotidyltransferase-like protein [Breznakibacter xylanolyticus]|uniref:Nucleotidyltransferase-like protein n=1 Tax=Breznakibacter xylanolyticus TaxID=990 RepID=A0A2W7NJ81_9BACT|nr:sugar phosphate nucleotidyltransferase [Breznakibacter xylanolyticus]PZX20308.1 nucleotidyltransferase-like protein [Breznakibacter xylanolyticus]